MLQSWELKERVQKYESNPFNVVERMYKKPDGIDFVASVLEMPDWVNILALNNKDEILLIRQFRFGTDQIELEIPGGCVELNEKPITAAKRELKEETGIIAHNMKQIGYVHSNPAIQTNRCFTFLATDLEDTGVVEFDPDEMIEAEWVQKEKCYQYIKEGKIKNTYIIAAFFWLQDV